MSSRKAPSLEPPRERVGDAGCLFAWWKLRCLRCVVLQPEFQLEHEMSYFDYGAAAELFPNRQKSRTMGAGPYMRFAAAAESVRYAIEVLPAKLLLGTFLEVNEERFDSGG